jgi:hypothetical protein
MIEEPCLSPELVPSGPRLSGEQFQIRTASELLDAPAISSGLRLCTLGLRIHLQLGVPGTFE